METMKKINLINGHFTSFEARELLMDLYTKNINFNKLQNFSAQIRYGNDDDSALERIVYLKESMEQITQILDEAKANNKKVVINSFIDIEIEY
jgi:protein-tyrosine phosphatase